MFNKEIIKKVIYDTVPVGLIEQVMVFGSRTRNEETADSDTDICIIVKNELPQEEMKRYRIALNKVFPFEYYMPTDVIIKSNNSYNRYKGVIGRIEHAIATEGVQL